MNFTVVRFKLLFFIFFQVPENSVRNEEKKSSQKLHDAQWSQVPKSWSKYEGIF